MGRQAILFLTHMTDSERQEPLILKLREIAGQIGEIENEIPEACDAENYDFQVKIGLATSIVEILDYDIPQIVHWFGWCLMRCGGIEIDPRIDALLDALANEVECQSEAMHGDDSDSGEKDGGTA